MKNLSSTVRKVLRLPKHTQSHVVDDSESGQTKLRVIFASGLLAAYMIAQLSGLFGELMPAVIGIGVYTIFAYVWAWAVAYNAFGHIHRRFIVIVIDEAVFCWAVWFSGALMAPLLWLPIFMTVGNGLRYGTRMAYFSATVASLFVAIAFAWSAFWQTIPGVAVGIVLGVFVIPTYAVALNLKLQRRQRDTQARAELLEQATRTDVLTGLANRLGYDDALQRCVADAIERREPGGLFYIDLDGFKAVNDIAGHASGDEVLKSVARLLRQSVRANDLVARLGGDEFAIVARGLRNAVDAKAIAKLALKNVRTIRIPGKPHLRIGATIGICLLPDEAVKTAEEATIIADEMMLAGKRHRKGSVRIYGDDADPAPSTVDFDSESFGPTTMSGELSAPSQAVAGVARTPGVLSLVTSTPVDRSL